MQQRQIKQTVFLLLIISSMITRMNAQEKRIIDWVNPMIGTMSMGHTFPGACAPFGAIQLSPDTEMIPHNINGKYQPEAYKYCAGYQYTDSTIVGFSHTHFNGTGHADLGDILIMPRAGKLHWERGRKEHPEEGYRQRFSHESEVSAPGYYCVRLTDEKIKAEFTATERVGLHKYTFEEAQQNKHILLDLEHGIYNYDGKVLMANIRVEDQYTLTGYRITSGWSRMNYIYFAIRFSQPIQQYIAHDDDKPLYQGFWRKFDRSKNFPEMFGRKLKAAFYFDDGSTKNLEIKVAISAVDALGALRNLEAECMNKSFDQVKKDTQNRWEKELSKIQIEGSDDTKTNFYTALYHTLISPAIYQDVDGRYRGIDGNIHQAIEGETNYTIFSLWDTFRALHPLMNFIQPSMSKQFVNAMLNHYDQSVHKALPIWSHMGNENWCMTGYHGVSVVSDAHKKNIPFNFKKAEEAVINSSNLSYYDGISDYQKLGYVPYETSHIGTSITLEYAYDDWCIYQMLSDLGVADSLVNIYKQRALNYRQVFSPTHRFAVPRFANGNYNDKIDFFKTDGQGFIEGNSWNFSFFAPHDVKGLINIMGGENVFVNRLDTLFTKHLPAKYYENTEDINEEGLLGCYVHGNEPGHHIPYLYKWTSQPWKSEAIIRQIMNKMYQNKINGLSGNDDCGQMSAWYVFSALGFYPVCPGSNEYVFGSPAINNALIHLENGKQLHIIVKNQADKNIYVQAIHFNGEKLNRHYITHDELIRDGKLIFTMSDKPNKETANYTHPYSLTNSKPFR